MPTAYDLNVFINCPFDREYIPLFDAILFTVYKCGFRPRCSLEFDDGGQVRIEKINKIIEECRFGIHDISRTELDGGNNLPRFNMPFELGLFLGAKRFGSKLQRSKVLMILDKERHRYHQYISDISGQDVKSHDNDPEKLIRCGICQQRCRCL
jgi:predicted nucleotide-binding protein